MPLYLVDRDLPGMTLPQIRSAQQRVLEAARRRAGAGHPVRYARSTYVPSQGYLMDVFEAADVEQVLQVNAQAQFPLLRVIEVADLTPGEEAGRGRRRDSAVPSPRGRRAARRAGAAPRRVRSRENESTRR